MVVTVHLIAAARPNFMKVAPVYHALVKEAWARPRIVHTGQHYDPEMSAAFFDDLGLPEPGFHLGVGSGSHAEQTAGVMVAYERVALQERPDWVIVVGDVNSTVACALTAKKLGLRVAHLEAGLRSGDMTMPEEINRRLTDAISDLLWTPSPDADENLRREDAPGRIVRVGNIMIDSYEMLRAKIEAGPGPAALGLDPGNYAVATLHRPSNVDSREKLAGLAGLLAEISRELPVVFPVHPRTRARLAEFGLWPLVEAAPGLKIHEPMGYVRFMSLVRGAKLIVTDSGGIQEETTYLNIPCLTLRENTERPVTVTQGTNRLVSAATLLPAVAEVMAGHWPQGRPPELWDGRAAGRVVESLKEAAFSYRR